MTGKSNVTIFMLGRCNTTVLQARKNCLHLRVLHIYRYLHQRKHCPCSMFSFTLHKGEKTFLRSQIICVFTRRPSTALHRSKIYKKQEKECLLIEYPSNNFPRLPYSGVVERQNIPARSHFISTRTDDQNSYQFLGTMESALLQTVGRVFCMLSKKTG